MSRIVGMGANASKSDEKDYKELEASHIKLMEKFEQSMQKIQSLTDENKKLKDENTKLIKEVKKE